MSCKIASAPASILSVYVNPFEPPKQPKPSGGSVTGSPCSRRMRYAKNRKNNLSSDTEEAWADALDREEMEMEDGDIFRQLQQETSGDPPSYEDWERGNRRPKVSLLRQISIRGHP